MYYVTINTFKTNKNIILLKILVITATTKNHTPLTLTYCLERKIILKKNHKHWYKSFISSSLLWILIYTFVYIIEDFFIWHFPTGKFDTFLHLRFLWNSKKKKKKSIFLFSSITQILTLKARVLLLGGPYWLFQPYMEFLWETLETKFKTTNINTLIPNQFRNISCVITKAFFNWQV